MTTCGDRGGHPPLFLQVLLTNYDGADDTDDNFDRRATIRGFAFNILIDEAYATCA